MEGKAGTALGLLLLMTLYNSSLAIDASTCRYSLGMEDKRIPDEDISASSSHFETVGPSYARPYITRRRLRQDEGDGAWCPRNMVTDESYEYLQVNMRTQRFVTIVAVQGRYDEGIGREFARRFRLEYSRDGKVWRRWKDRTGNELLEGNTDSMTPVLRDLDPPFIGNHIRFIPLSNDPGVPQTVCMRVEMYGCEWNDGLVSYSMPPGQSRGEVLVNDATYDGAKSASLVYSGLGQLTDGITGPDNFLLDVSGMWSGYEWVGWKNTTKGTKPVELTFEFENARNFTTMKIHCNNFFLREAKVFDEATISFSIEGTYYSRTPIVYKHILDTNNYSARWVTINLNHNIGKFLKVRFTYADSWMLFSEVSFDSVTGNFSHLTDEEYVDPMLVTETVPLPIEIPNGEIVMDGSATSLTTVDPNGSDHTVDAAVSADGNDTEVTTVDTSITEVDGQSGLPNVAIIVGILVAIIFVLMVVILLILWRHKRKTKAKPPKETRGFEQHIALNVCMPNGHNNQPSVRHANPSYHRIRPNDPEYQEPHNFLRKLPDLPALPAPVAQSRENSGDAVYAEPDFSLCAANPNVKIPHYAEAEIVNIQGVAGTNTYAVPNVNIDMYSTSTPPEFPRHNLRFQEKLGEGQFGEVHLCEAEGMREFVGGDFCLTHTKDKPVLVAVKMLRPDATKNARTDFFKEVKILARLRDANIVRLLGVCTRDEPLCMIVEYMENGDLNQYLFKHEFEGGVASASNAPMLGLGALLYMAAQIASGMKYLSSLNFVHRDLATRNCLVGPRHSVRIADFGMSRNLYCADYYRIQGRAVLPIRWMAWESILMGKFTSQSDIWAFGVTLWEVLTLAKEQPYAHLSDEQVIENTGEFFKDEGRQVHLSQPAICPSDTYAMMRKCWKKEPENRPTFEDLCVFLQRKNIGFLTEV
ncbi:discoidin domain-containing receptor 2-like isoform X1 [Branchiostoma lanceolatum]|uniref:discoidin domain-containing receptor 2-like isoform X1 n=1 Tax=Branchiostoma lanceolatum TaxID=7740 RepID=UPI0034571946